MLAVSSLPGKQDYLDYLSMFRVYAFRDGRGDGDDGGEERDGQLSSATTTIAACDFLF